jgi:hypothetical protein
MEQNNTIFYNSDYIVIEYIDLLKSPYLVLLNVVRKNPRLKEILKIEEIEYLDQASLYEWYVMRKHQNFFIDLNRYPNQINEETMDKILDDQINSSKYFYTSIKPLKLMEMLFPVNKQKLVKGIIIYHPHNNDFAKNDLESLTSGKYIFMSDWNEVMNKAGFNSTYFISDIDKVIAMKEKGVLRCSSVTLPIEYRYNKKNMTDMKYDLDELYKEAPFKLSYINSAIFMDA